MAFLHRNTQNIDFWAFFLLMDLQHETSQLYALKVKLKPALLTGSFALSGQFLCNQNFRMLVVPNASLYKF